MTRKAAYTQSRHDKRKEAIRKNLKEARQRTGLTQRETA